MHAPQAVATSWSLAGTTSTRASTHTGNERRLDGSILSRLQELALMSASLASRLQACRPVGAAGPSRRRPPHCVVLRLVTRHSAGQRTTPPACGTSTPAMLATRHSTWARQTYESCNQSKNEKVQGHVPWTGPSRSWPPVI
ncbi:hypothetical protein L226DRAFT_322381 [Lentinus tigrinus ALCF2SS1-7]|uniref:uncharacterized protein n=1 Tax=Lentinus tigrinus ALCF2SS1-7 TaxID=1328758 RepID=UPI0011663003|nr:hypothetical protein L226DRAFT_322381 [Lentinus tigrinus ALCF2SS1-7]